VSKTGNKIAILLNGLARRRRNKPITDEQASQILHRDVTIYATGSLDELADAVTRILHDGTDLLAISGGDGTIHLMLTELINQAGELAKFPDFLILRGGTMNIASATLGTRRPPLMGLRALGIAMELEEKKSILIPSKTVRPLKVEGHGDRSLYGFVFAAGVPPRILQEYNKGDPSPARAANVTTTILLESFMRRHGDTSFLESVKAKIMLDGKPYGSEDYKVIVASPLPKLLLWFDLFDSSMGHQENGFFCLVNSMKTRTIARNFWTLSRGKYIGPGQVNSIFHKIQTDRPTMFTMDGEVYEEDENDGLTITSGPLLRFLDLSGIRISGFLPDTWHYDHAMSTDKDSQT